MCMCSRLRAHWWDKSLVIHHFKRVARHPEVHVAPGIKHAVGLHGVRMVLRTGVEGEHTSQSGKLVGGTNRVMSLHLAGELVPMLKSAGALWL